jgi:hypothetical protein
MPRDQMVAVGSRRELFGDELARTDTWRGRPAVDCLAGRPVCLRDADLYAMRFVP